jgi:hypothetical protein
MLRCSFRIAAISATHSIFTGWTAAVPDKIANHLDFANGCLRELVQQ